MILTLLLSLSTAYLQSAVFALASLWGSPQVLAVMSGQGGIAVLVSLVQVILAVISSLHSTNSDVRAEHGSQTRLAGVGIWALGAVGTMVCLSAHQYLVRHPDYSSILRPFYARLDTAEETIGRSMNIQSSVTVKVLKKNWQLEFAVAWVFVVTLVSVAYKSKRRS